jgi:hypothetical protein
MNAKVVDRDPVRAGGRDRLELLPARVAAIAYPPAVQVG